MINNYPGVITHMFSEDFTMVQSSVSQVHLRTTIGIQSGPGACKKIKVCYDTFN